MAGLLTPGLNNDLSTLFNDLLAHADPTQLRADLTAVVSAVRASPFDAVEIRTVTPAVIDFLQTHSIIFDPPAASDGRHQMGKAHTPSQRTVLRLVGSRLE